METGETGTKAAQRRALGVFFLALASVFGLLGTPAVLGYFVWTAVPAVMAVVTLVLVGEAWRKRFAALACANFLVACLVHFLPHAGNGGVGGFGLLVVLCCIAVDILLLWNLFKSETARWMQSN